MKKILTLLLLLPAMFAAAQIDTATLRQYYDRAIDFSADKTDSMLYYARLLDKASVEQHFTRGKVLASRLKGLAADMRGDYDLAITWYLQSLEEARRLGEARYIITALSDLAILYDQIKQPEKSMQYYLESLPLLRQLNEISMLLPAYNNLAVIYSHLGNYDSALLLLQESLDYRNKMSEQVDFSSTLNNLGTIYFRKGDFKKALQYFKENYAAHQQSDDVDKLWLDHLNLADNYSELKQLDSAEIHANMALEDALRLNSKSKEADSYSIMAKVQERKGNYKQAFRYLKKWYTLDSTLINIETSKTIAALQEKYNAKQRDEENKILLAGIEKEKIQNQNITLIAFTLGSIAILSVLAFMAIRNANKKLKLANQALNKQKENLAELNEEKNALIGIVSHDLHSPFAGIEVWCRLLESEKQRLSDEQIKALERIREAGTYGQNLINRILDVERETGANASLQITAVNMNELLQDMANQYEAMAAQKQIE
ncbi:MAG TPA: tetratricopeptide repeat protein, partial [Chitinophagaceae bacterium]|nr:tetratricopeptide repeat protein [Chitinophagaceae bacterium]